MNTSRVCTEIPDSAYLSLLPTQLSEVLECSLNKRPWEEHIERFASSVVATLADQGALIPSQLEMPSISLLGLTLFHHLRTPDNPIAWFNLAVALRVTAHCSPNKSPEQIAYRLSLAASACLKTLDSHPDAIRTWTELGITLHLLDETDQALEIFEEGLKIKPDDVSLWLWKAFALEHLGLHTEALQSTKAARSFYVGEPADQNLQHLFEGRNDEETLVALLSRAEQSIRQCALT